MEKMHYGCAIRQKIGENVIMMLKKNREEEFDCVVTIQGSAVPCTD